MGMTYYKIKCYFMDTYADTGDDAVHTFTCWAEDAVYAAIQEKYNVSDEKMKTFNWKTFKPDELDAYCDVCSYMYDTIANYYIHYFVEYITRFATLSYKIEAESADDIREIRKKFCIETYNSHWVENFGIYDGEVSVEDWEIEAYMNMFKKPLIPAKVIELIESSEINLDYPFDFMELARFLSTFNSEYFKEELDSYYEAGDGILKYVFERSINPTIFSKWFNYVEKPDYFEVKGSTNAYECSSLAEEIIHNRIFEDFRYALFHNNAKNLRNFIEDEWQYALEESNSWLEKEYEDFGFSDIVEIVANHPEMQAFLKENASNLSNNAESKEITKEDVLEAIKAYDEGKRPENCGTSKTVFLVHNGKTYPIKAIYALATGVEGGSFHIKAEKTLKNLGFTIARTE